VTSFPNTICPRPTQCPPIPLVCPPFHVTGIPPFC
jgi:hypothetical protein